MRAAETILWVFAAIAVAMTLAALAAVLAAGRAPKRPVPPEPEPGDVDAEIDQMIRSYYEGGNRG